MINLTKKYPFANLLPFKRKRRSWLRGLSPNSLTYERCLLEVRNDGYEFEYVPKELMNDEIYNIAIKTYPMAGQHAPVGSSMHNDYLMRKALL